MSSTESSSLHDHLEKMDVRELLVRMNNEDKNVAAAVEQAIPEIELLVKVITDKLKTGGRLFYIGAGTSGRLGILDASEIPPTFGVPQGKVIGLIAGGDKAIRQSVEHAEDDFTQAWKDLSEYHIDARDVVVGIAASGRTPYVLGGIRHAKTNGIVTGCITCNAGSDLAKAVDYPIEIIVGPEFVTGSTRMKAGTAQKLVLNMISTSTMIQLGHVIGNKMIDMQLTNDKLIDRGTRFIMEALGIEKEAALLLLKKFGSVRAAVENKK